MITTLGLVGNKIGGLIRSIHEHKNPQFDTNEDTHMSYKHYEESGYSWGCHVCAMSPHVIATQHRT